MAPAGSSVGSRCRGNISLPLGQLANSTAKPNGKTCCIRTCVTSIPLSDENSSPSGGTFCSHMFRLGKSLTKQMTTRCPGCHESTDHRPPSSTLAPELPSKPRPAHAPPSEAVLNFASTLCGYVAASESHALDHFRTPRPSAHWAPDF